MARHKLLAARVELLSSLGWAVAREGSDGSPELNPPARVDLERRGLSFERPTATVWKRLQEALGVDVTLADLGARILVWQPQQAVVSPRVALTPREAEVRDLLQAGKSTGEIATILQRSRRTIEKHQQTLYRKLGVSCADQLILLRQM